MKKVLDVPFINVPEDEFLLADLDHLARHNLDEVCWIKLKNKPHVQFSIAYNTEALWLRYFVDEINYRATYTRSNDPVFKDSCVEFFVAVDGSSNYYNFEFNGLGTCLASYGRDRKDRIKLDAQTIDHIERKVKWKDFSPEKNKYNWELTLMIKPQVFCFNHIVAFEAGDLQGNFYKCGDELPEPHFLAWNPVLSSNMDFHQHEYLGTLKLL